MTTLPTSRAIYPFTKLLTVCSFTVALACLCVGVRAQGTTPQRGFHPNGSYALNEIESVNMSSGNLSLRIPLASLPAGRGTAPQAAVYLLYNSKLYDSRAEIHNDPIDPSNSYSMNVLTPVDGGGWRYGVGYTLTQYNRADEYVGYLPPCNSDEFVYHWKLKMTFPDGGEHEFRPVNFNQSSTLGGDGYYNVDLNGYQTNYNCTGSWAYTGGMTYYSTDGTYMRLEVDHDGDHQWWNNTWTLYMPDGTRVAGGGTAPQRVYDRNNNYVEIRQVTLPSGQPATQVVDQLGRAITLQAGSSANEDYVTVSGFNGEEVRTAVRWKEAWVYKQYRATLDLLPQGVDPNRELHASFYFVDQITTPSQAGSLTYNFDYNASATRPTYPNYTDGWGYLSYMKLPTGAESRYRYQTEDGGVYAWSDALEDHPTRKDLTYRREGDGVAVSNSPCTSNCVTDTWHYSVIPGFGLLTTPDGGTVKEYFYSALNGPADAAGLVYKSQLADGTVVEREWQTNTPRGTSAANYYVKREYTSPRDAAGNYNVTATKEYSRDKNGNVTSAKEYDWVGYSTVPRDAGGKPVGVPSGAPLKRVTTTAYYNPTPDAADTNTLDYDVYVYRTGRRLINTAESVEVSADGGNALSRSEFFYDDASLTGNLTEERTWDSTKGALSRPLSAANSHSTARQYDGYGNLQLMTDPRGTQTHFVYGPVGGFFGLYPTETRVAYNTSVQRTSFQEYDYWSGLVTRSTDADNNVSTATTYDAFGRPTLFKAAEGKPEETRTSTHYSDVQRRVITRSDLNTVGDAKLVSVRHFDQLGRVRLSRYLEDASTQSAEDETVGVKTQTRHLSTAVVCPDGSVVGSYQLDSRPYRAATSPGAGSEPTMGWVVTKRDTGGRVFEVHTFSGAAAPSPCGAGASSTGRVLTSYDAEFTTATDQAGKVRRRMTDGLGRLARVDEPDAAGSLGAKLNPAQKTTYVYDALNNLRTVEQDAQRRHFMYDSLSRLVRSKLPEQDVNNGLPALSDSVTGHNQWSTSYAYDANGNLTERRDARDRKTAYAYDLLNRLRQTFYRLPDGSPDPDTPDVERTYDGATNGRGRPWHTWTTTGPRRTKLTYVAYDPLGRVKQAQQFQHNGSDWGAAYDTQRFYNLAGDITQQTYPSGRAVNYGYDAAGRLDNFSGNLGDSATRTYSTAITYDAAGRVRQERFGTQVPVYNKRFYNPSGQLSEIRVSTHSLTSPGEATNWNRGAIINHYSDQSWAGSGPDNNGNLRKQDIYIPGDDAINSHTLKTQQFFYDSLNRLDWVREFGGGAPDRVQDYSYDRYGNRTVNASNTTPDLPAPQFAVNAATNRLQVPAGQTGVLQYDAAGNLTNDTHTGYGSRTYDAEGRVRTAQNAYGQTSTYTYDGGGYRVCREAGGQEVWLVYGIEGELLAEYAQNASPTTPQKEYGYRNGELLVQAAAPVASGTGLVAQYFDNMNFTNLKVTRAEASVNFDWGFGSPSPSVVNETFTARWTGQVEPRYTETYTFYTHTDDGVRLWVNGQLLVDRWVDQGTTEWGGQIALQAGQRYDIRMDYYENGGGAVAKLLWASASQAKEVVPQSQLYPPGSGAQAGFEWLVTDQLGTPRMVFDRTGSLAGVKRHDYLPFGEELTAGQGGRTWQEGYAADGVKQKFTSKERDADTGLDYFGGRYFSAPQGRFDRPDPLHSSASPDDPQSWNRYSYALNNPLKYTDPTGLYTFSAALGGSASDDELRAGARTEAERRRVEEIIRLRNRFREGMRAAARAAESSLLSPEERAAIRRAVQSYGTENDGNGVVVAFDSDTTSQGAVTDGKDPAGIIVVTFGLGGVGDLMTLNVAHEGIHVADWQVFNNFTEPSGRTLGGPSLHQTETSAYFVSSAIARALNRTDWQYDVGGQTFRLWDRDWESLPSFEREAARAVAVDRIVSLRMVNRQPLTSTNPGLTYGMSRSLAYPNAPCYDRRSLLRRR